jgi:hypothetical protein
LKKGIVILVVILSTQYALVHLTRFESILFFLLIDGTSPIGLEQAQNAPISGSSLND